MEQDETVFNVGEDIGGLGGGFRATQGLYEKFGRKRVLDTPLSEIAIVGAAIGAALGGLRPIPEIMYIDFTPACMDMIVNQMAKIHYMFGGQIKVPMVLRLVSGAAGYNAAQHSQSIYHFFVHLYESPAATIAAAALNDEAATLARSLSVTVDFLSFLPIVVLSGGFCPTIGRWHFY